MNILVNGIQAIEGEGEIFITTSVEKDHVKINLRDTGKGIPEKIKNLFSNLSSPPKRWDRERAWVYPSVLE